MLHCNSLTLVWDYLFRHPPSLSLNKGKGNLYLKSKTNAIGVFYEKEKSVALFYDFERFEELSLGGQNDEWKNYY